MFAASITLPRIVELRGTFLQTVCHYLELRIAKKHVVTH